MTTQATLAWQSAAALLTGLACSAAIAGTVNGRIAFPGPAVPATMVYLRNLDTHALHQHALKRSETEFSIEVPAGRYWVFMRPDEPGLTELYGAHTRFSVCRRTPGGDVVAACTDHALVELEVPAGDGVTHVEVDDWMLSDEAAAELDRVLGRAPAPIGDAELGWPRFSEYRVAPPADGPPAQPDVASDPRAAPLAGQLHEAARLGSNFAGRFTLVRVACGEQCAQVVVIDQADGAVLFPEPPSRTLGTLPCRAEHDLEFRDDSRLLALSRREADSVVTEYLLWQTEQRSFVPLAENRRSFARFCGDTTAVR